MSECRLALAFRQDAGNAVGLLPRHGHGMLTEIYTEALLVDEELADHAWEAWDKGRLMTR